MTLSPFDFVMQSAPNGLRLALWVPTLGRAGRRSTGKNDKA